MNDYGIWGEVQRLEKPAPGHEDARRIVLVLPPKFVQRARIESDETVAHVLGQCGMLLLRNQDNGFPANQDVQA